jgi:outer membrane biosynthesis protein TonB
MGNLTAFARLLLLPPLALAAAAQGPRAEGAASPKRASLVVESEEAAVQPAPPVPQGEERRAIGDTVRDHSGPVRDCYEKRLQEKPTLQGKLVVRFDIGPNGKVIGASGDGIADRDLIVCVLAAVRKLEFDRPRSGGKLRVAYPFKFEPRPAK